LDCQTLIEVTERTWSLSPLNQFQLKDWGEEEGAVAFSMRSGDTHLLTPLPLALLALLGQASASTQSLVESLAEELDAMSVEEAMEQVEATLLELEDMGFVCSVSS